MPPAEILANSGITKLEAEPQEGPTEYKLHLLLRPRRSFIASSTDQHVSGSYLSKSRTPPSHSETDLKSGSPAPVLAPSSQSRQNRLQHLTTQLLWRLQQSSRYHSSSKSNLVLPILPEADVELSASKGPGPLISGLEESSGALYEIGVSDDGTFVGLARDELEESLIVLRAMAFSLGCDVQIVRMMIVGDCQWSEETQTKKKPVITLWKDKLWVAEVLVSPYLGSNKQATELAASVLDSRPAVGGAIEEHGSPAMSHTVSQSEQLRVSLTGSTTSGKSSLLGTLSTSTLDNGRGKSRLSLLKHRHEIDSGVTSSLAQELFGYKNSASSNDACAINVINYASGNVSSWNDIHAASEQGRLVFVTDSAGHPRYRRTTVRGLVSWAPHWTLCCTAADDEEDSTGKLGATASSSEVLGSAGQGVDLSKAHLKLCLKLNSPLVIVITKFDIATKTGLRSTMAKILTTLKSAGRKPVIIPSPSSSNDAAHLQSITNDDVRAAEKAMVSVSQSELKSLVPIVLTSAVTGSGIGRLHALLRQLPIALRDTEENGRMSRRDEAPPRSLFHVDEVFAMPPSGHAQSSEGAKQGIISSGYLRYGLLEVGDKMLIGPCVPDVAGEVPPSPKMHRASSFPGLIKRSPRALTRNYDMQRPSSGDFSGIEDSARETSSAQTWQEVRITSLRNLRLPVQKLHADQVGTVGVTFPIVGLLAANTLPTTSSCIRRGMVMIPAQRGLKAGPPPAYTRFSAVFPQASLPAWPGVLVVVYIASIRASAKIVEVKALEGTAPTVADEVFDFGDNDSDDIHRTLAPDSPTDNQHTEITFEFASSREWIELGTEVLVTPGGGPSLTGQPEQRDVSSAGLDGYVGTITLAMVQ
ncbi:hypothetical protein OEA41_002487 [Lepraria neglecta]|uniref:Tr-type G domain-containing protein n=1 Tax=Lepraria neglecta TaxID=209136 RepID=A0AAD9ZBP4_9LECA|nr:hypothetical protein OEA41_002487 [Lepraria neglecta]